MPIDNAINLTRQLLVGTQAIHERGFIHRDIKTPNILLGEKGSHINPTTGAKSKYYRQLKIADFGLSRVMAIPPKHMTKEIATLHYRAPEVILDNLQYTQAVDMFSIGIVIYEMLTGLFLFNG